MNNVTYVCMCIWEVKHRYYLYTWQC